MTTETTLEPAGYVIPTIDRLAWDTLTSDQRHRMEWPGRPGAITTEHNAWTVGAEVVTMPTMVPGGSWRDDLIELAAEVGVPVQFVPAAEPSARPARKGKRKVAAPDAPVPTDAPGNPEPPPVTTAPDFRVLHLAELHESATNPRRTYAGLEDLAASMRAKGVLVPLLVRPCPDGGFEIVAGHRRYRAAQLAGLTEVPCVVRDLTDQQVLEVQIVENLQREDLHPLEEADGYRALIDQYHYSVEDLAAKVAKSTSYVYRRMQLAELVPVAREAFLEGKLLVGGALCIARMPEALQAQACETVTARVGDGEEPWPASAVSREIEQDYMLRLESAPFETARMDLVGGAGACTSCPRRTGNQAELFADIKSPDVCTDPACFHAKRAADWEERTAKARAAGAKVLSEKETKKVFQYGSQIAYGSEYVDLGEKPYDLGEGRKSYKSILGKHAPPVTLAQDPHGGTHELIAKKDLAKALKDAGVEKKRATGVVSTPAQKAAREKTRLANQVVPQALAEIVAAAEKAPVSEDVLRYLARSFTLGSWSEVVTAVQKRRELKGSLGAEIPKLSKGGLVGLVVELLATKGAVGWEGRYGDPLRDAAKLYGVDLRAIERRVSKETTPAKAKKTVPKKPARKARP